MIVSIRPEKFRIYDHKPDVSEDLNAVQAEVVDVVYQGAYTKYWVMVNDFRVSVMRQHNRCYLDMKQPTWGDKIWIAWHRDDVATLPNTEDY